jgi:hypothetical protein
MRPLCCWLKTFFKQHFPHVPTPDTQADHVDSFSKGRPSREHRAGDCGGTNASQARANHPRFRLYALWRAVPFDPPGKRDQPLTWGRADRSSPAPSRSCEHIGAAALDFRTDKSRTIATWAPRGIPAIVRPAETHGYQLNSPKNRVVSGRRLWLTEDPGRWQEPLAFDARRAPTRKSAKRPLGRVGEPGGAGNPPGSREPHVKGSRIVHRFRQSKSAPSGCG